MSVKLSKEIVNKRIYEKGFLLLTEYRKAKLKETFKCKNNHTWISTVDSVMRGSGCPECAGQKKLTKESVNNQLKLKGIILIGEVNGARSKSKFQCSKGHEWETSVSKVLHNTGCPICSHKFKLSKDLINERLSDRKIVLLSDYEGKNTSIGLFQCSEGHKWKSIVNNILSGRNCPECAEYGFKKHKPAILYYLNIIGSTIYKIGITNRTVKERFNNIDLKKIIIIKTWHYDKGINALKIEQYIKNHYKIFKYIGEPVLESGNSELFNSDVMGLDKWN